MTEFKKHMRRSRVGSCFPSLFPGTCNASASKQHDRSHKRRHGRRSGTKIVSLAEDGLIGVITWQ